MTEKWSRAVLRGLGSRKAPRLPDTMRQSPVGKTHSGACNGKPLGFKTIIRPSKEGVHRHVQAMRKIVQRSQFLPQEELIAQLNPVILGWARYYRTVPRDAQRVDNKQAM